MLERKSSPHPDQASIRWPQSIRNAVKPESDLGADIDVLLYNVLQTECSIKTENNSCLHIY